MRRQLPLLHFPLLLYLLLLTRFSGPHGPSSSYSSKFFTTAAAATPRKVPVGLVLDLSVNTVVGRTSRTSISIAVEDFYTGVGRNYSTRIDLRLRNYNGDVINATADVVDLIKNDGVVAVIGPQRPSELTFVAEIGTFAHVPIISFSATATSLSRNFTPYFIRAANNDAAQADAIAALARAFGWQQLVPVYEDSNYGSGFMPLLVDTLKEAANCRVPARAAIIPSATNDSIRVELLRLNMMQTRVFVVHASRQLAQQVFRIAAEEGMMGLGYAWIITETTASLLGAVPQELVLDAMQGVLGVRAYVPNNKATREFRRRWKKQFVRENPDDDRVYEAELSTFGLWAYDTVFALATAVEVVLGSSGSGANMSGTVHDVAKTVPTSSELSSLPRSAAGERLLNAILGTGIPNGISGEFHLVDGELRGTAFEIVNVNGATASVVGYWTKSRGLSRKLDLSVAPENASGPLGASRNDLELIRWPGGTAATPKGWVQKPLAGKRLRVYVPGPTEPGFHAFLQSNRDNITNVTMEVNGYVVEVFEAAVKKLPYAIRWEYETNRTKDGNSIGNYDQLVELVQNGTYDAIVGDVTITANRSQLVDFTIPYTTSGVRMVVPKQDHRSSGLWIFLKPLTNSVWIAIGCSFVYTGISLWLLEHRVNEDFHQESLSNRMGSLFYLSFSTLVVAHRQQMNSNASKVALVVWLFVVWIFQSCYTASLTSMLTVRQVQPTVAEIKDLLSGREYIGYLKSSFVKQELLDMGFSENRLKPYKSPEQYADALARGSANGGVGAVVDEIPYLKIFLKDYCSNYTITGEPIPTAGFGFVFPKGSPLVPDLSRAILNITEGDAMVEIERKWFGDESACARDDSPFSSNRLDLASFGGLFIVTGTTSVVALLCFLFTFVYGHRQILIGREGGGSMIQRVKTLTKEFDRKKEDVNEGSMGSSLRHRLPSRTPLCAHCGCHSILPGMVGGGKEVGSERAINIIVDGQELTARDRDTIPSRHLHSTSPPQFIDLSTPPRTSIDFPVNGTDAMMMEMSSARFSTSTEFSSRRTS